MLLIQTTKKLADQLNVKSTKDQIIQNDSLYAWHAHLFVFDRRKYVIVMNNKSRYNFILGGLVKKDFMRFEALVKDAIKENLIADELDAHVVQKYLEQCDTINFAPTDNRSIISQMNEMILVTKHIWNAEGLKTKDIDLADLNRRNNRFVMLTLPERYSVKAMKSALEKIED